MRSVLALLLAVSGCASMEKIDPAIQSEASQPLVCGNKQQCDLYWQRAQAYVNQHSNYRVQSVTDNILTTYGPTGTSTDLAYRLTKVPNADGSATIEMTLGCSDYIIGCKPNSIVETANLKRYIRAH